VKAAGWEFLKNNRLVLPEAGMAAVNQCNKKALLSRSKKKHSNSKGLKQVNNPYNY
jgi:hypothetical protein